LRAWRVDRLISQDELCAKTGIAKSTLSKLENARNEANLATVGKIADALGLTRQQLVYEAPPARMTTAPHESDQDNDDGHKQRHRQAQ
jgi:transcriptional regulator with XRE-family HTH domain